MYNCQRRDEFKPALCCVQSWPLRLKSSLKGEGAEMLVVSGVCLYFDLHMWNVRRYLNRATGLCSFLFSAATTDSHLLTAKKLVKLGVSFSCSPQKHVLKSLRSGRYFLLAWEVCCRMGAMWAGNQNGLDEWNRNERILQKGCWSEPPLLWFLSLPPAVTCAAVGLGMIRTHIQYGCFLGVSRKLHKLLCDVFCSGQGPDLMSGRGCGSKTLKMSEAWTRGQDLFGLGVGLGRSSPCVVFPPKMSIAACEA